MSGQYRVILADPPWQYRVIRPSATFHSAKIGKGFATRYATMNTDALCAIPVASMAAKDAALFLWVTAPCMQDGLRVMAAWGFEYKTVAFNWVKLNRKTPTPWNGGGHYTRSNSELCLIGRRGQPRRLSGNVQQVIHAPVRQHSRKPDEVYERIMRLFDGPYLELFARQQWPGWDVWGNQAGKFPAQPFLFGEVPA